ncbi:MAG TPA: hypothetical protein VF598_07210, partial [Hymenobacter sp.]
MTTSRLLLCLVLAPAAASAQHMPGMRADTSQHAPMHHAGMPGMSMTDTSMTHDGHNMTMSHAYSRH